MGSEFLGKNIDWLVKNRNYKLLREYINTVCDPDIPCTEDGSTLLYAMSKDPGTFHYYSCARREMVEFLIHKGADVLWQHKITGFSPAVHIIQTNDDELVDLVLSKLDGIDAPLDSVDGTPLHHAVRRGNNGTVLKLLNRGADPNRTNKAGYTAVHEAVLSKRGRPMLKILMEHGGDMNMMAGGLLRPIQMTVYTQHPKESLFSVLQCKPDLALADATGHSALWFFIAEFDQRTEEILMLVDNGCDVHFENQQGWNLLHLLASKSSCCISGEIVKALIEGGIDINAQIPADKNTPLHLAISIGSSFMVSQLVYHNADVSLKNANNQTAFDLAVMKVRLDAQELILSLSILEGKRLDEIGNVPDPDTIAGEIVQTLAEKRRDELELMKSTKLEFSDSISLYDLLRFKETKLAKLFKNSEFQSNFGINNNCFKPLRCYKYHMNEKIRNAVRLRRAKEEVTKYLYSHLGNKLSLLSVERTVSVMDKKTLFRVQRRSYNSQIYRTLLDNELCIYS